MAPWLLDLAAATLMIVAYLYFAWVLHFRLDLLNRQWARVRFRLEQWPANVFSVMFLGAALYVLVTYGIAVLEGERFVDVSKLRAPRQVLIIRISIADLDRWRQSCSAFRAARLIGWPSAPDL